MGVTVKKGVVKGTSENGNLSETLNVWEIDFDGEKFLAVKEAKDGFLTRTTFDHSLDNMGRFFSERDYGSNPAIEWTEPLSEVPSTGGEGVSVLDVYPVGIEITTSDTAFNPMKAWGGTWTMTPSGSKRVWKRTA
jgi:hypothetical protein|nr:MAG TPA: hypothetical protein [Caudoviricetes sp.]